MYDSYLHEKKKNVRSDIGGKISINDGWYITIYKTCNLRRIKTKSKLMSPS